MASSRLRRPMLRGQCQTFGKLLSVETFRGEVEEGRCSLDEGHSGMCVHHRGDSEIVIDAYRQETLSDAQWRALSALDRGERVVIPASTRNWLRDRGWITLHGHSNLSTSARITDAGRAVIKHAKRMAP